MQKSTLTLCLSSTLLLTACAQTVSNAPDNMSMTPFTTIANNNPTQDRIDNLLTQAMHYYWHGGDLRKSEAEFFKGLTLKGDQNVVEALLKQVIELDPLNTDYQRALASTLVINNKLDQAVALLHNVVATEPNNYAALVQYYVYSGLQTKHFDTTILAQMNQLDPIKTQQLAADFAFIETIRAKEVSTQLPQYEENHLFVLLGYALSDEGEMRDTMLNRLQYALKLLKINPTAKIIVSGGVPKKGDTEAKVMRSWLIEQGIDVQRIIEEGLATDTVENALFSMRKAHSVASSHHLTVISSASHVRRAQSLFERASHIVNRSTIAKPNVFTIDALGEPDSPTLIKASDDKERLVMYRDMLRLEGFWQYPNWQR